MSDSLLVDLRETFLSWLNVKSSNRKRMEITTKKFRAGIHAAVNILYCLCAVNMALRMSLVWPLPAHILNNELFQEYFTHGLIYKSFLLSVWVGAFENVYFASYSVIDVLDLNWGRNGRIVKTIDFIHVFASYLLFTIVFPMSMIILTLFWSLFAFNREIILPQILDEVFPPIQNHILHTMAAPLSALYMLTSNKYVPSQKSSLFGLVLFLSFYWYTTVRIYFRDGKWVYYFFNFMTYKQAQCALLFIFLLSIGFHHLGYKLNEWVKYMKRQLVIDRPLKNA